VPLFPVFPPVESISGSESALPRISFPPFPHVRTIRGSALRLLRLLAAKNFIISASRSRPFSLASTLPASPPLPPLPPVQNSQRPVFLPNIFLPRILLAFPHVKIPSPVSALRLLRILAAKNFIVSPSPVLSEIQNVRSEIPKESPSLSGRARL
jgi:hypothetical protein